MKKLLSFPLSILFLLFFNFSNSQATVQTVSSFDASATLKIGDQIDVILSFNAPVTVTGTPQLELETGLTDTKINYISGSGSPFITFRYTVVEGNTSSDLDYTSTSALTLNGGTINGPGNQPVTLTLPSPGATGSLAGIGDDEKNFIVDGVKPTMTITASQISNGGSFTGNLSLTFTSSEATTNFVVGDMTLSNGTLSSFSGSGTTYTATFTPTAEGAATIDVAADKFTDSAGNGNSAATQFSWSYDVSNPTLSSVAATNGTYKVGDNIDITVTWNETVNVTGTPTITLSNGATATYQSGTGSAALVFRYAVVEGNTDSSDLSVSSYSGTVKDTAGNTAGAVSGDLGSVIVDANSPSISAIATTAFSWGAVLNATEDNANGTVTVSTTGVEDGQTVTITLNSANYTNTITDNATTVLLQLRGFRP